jgi:hypothetical protein
VLVAVSQILRRLEEVIIIFFMVGCGGLAIIRISFRSRFREGLVVVVVAVVGVFAIIIKGIIRARIAQ